MSYINIDNSELKKLMKDEEKTILIDVRTQEEFEEQNIEKSINIPINELMYIIEDMEKYKDKNIIIYCRSGQRSITACNLLELAGFSKLYNLERGIIGYI